MNLPPTCSAFQAIALSRSLLRLGYAADTAARAGCSAFNLADELQSAVAQQATLAENECSAARDELARAYGHGVAMRATAKLRRQSVGISLPAHPGTATDKSIEATHEQRSPATA
jgi:hypothetical protein